MQTSKWGPHYWVALHTVAHNYNPDLHDKKDYINYYKMVGQTLPCKYCRESFTQFFKELPIKNYLSCQRDMAYWMYLMHNKVNDKLRKQGLLNKPNPSFESVYNKYEQFRADCSKKRGKPDTCRMPNMRNRCKATTHRGRQCTRKRGKGSNRYCLQHQNSQRKK